MQTINLMPPGYARKERAKRRLIISGGVLVAVLLGMVGLARLMDKRVADKHKAIEIIEREVTDVVSTRADLAAITIQLRTLSERIKVVRTVEHNRRWASYLARIARAAHKQVLLTRANIAPVRAKTNDSGAARGPTGIRAAAPPPHAPAQASPATRHDASKPECLVLLLEGYAGSNTDVTRFVAELGRANIFDKVRFKSSEMAEINGKPLSRFELECPIRYAARGQQAKTAAPKPLAAGSPTPLVAASTVAAGEGTPR